MSLTKVTYSMIDGAVANVLDYGAVGDGVADDTAAIVAAVTYVKTNGGVLYFPPGIYLTEAIQTGGGTKPWAMVGAGKDLTIIKAKTGAGSLINGSASSVGYTIKGFTVNNQFSVYADVNARQGIAILNTSNVTVEDVFVTDYKLSAILIYGDTPNVYSNGRMINCSCDGLGVAINGFLFVDMDDCHYIECVAKNVVFAGVDGQIIYVQTINDARDVVVKHNTGNILLTGAADVTLPNRRSYLVLTYNNFSAKWIELYRVINP